ncbi:unnamed protein product [Ixodes persulcatus]
MHPHALHARHETRKDDARLITRTHHLPTNTHTRVKSINTLTGSEKNAKSHKMKRLQTNKQTFSVRGESHPREHAHINTHGGDGQKKHNGFELAPPLTATDDQRAPRELNTSQTRTHTRTHTHARAGCTGVTSRTSPRHPVNGEPRW